MTDNMKQALRFACVFTASGLMISFFVFFLFFGKGLQILMPLILFIVFFFTFVLLEKIPFVSHRPIIKAIVGIALIIIAASLL